MNLIDRVIAGFGPEDHEHYVFVQWCDAMGLDVFHVPNSTWTKSIMQRTKNTLLGVRAGIPDLWVVVPGVGLLVVEMKRRKETRKTNYATPAQRAWIEKLNAVPGVQATVCYGADEAIKFVKEYYAPAKTTAPTRQKAVDTQPF